VVRKKKNSKALFEVLSQGKGIVEIPEWIKKKPEDQAENAPDKELPKDELPSEKVDQTEVEPVEAEEPTVNDVEAVEPEPEEHSEETPEEQVVEEDEDQSVAETTDAELITIEQDAVADEPDDVTEAVEVDDDEEIAEDIEEPDKESGEEVPEKFTADVIPRVNHVLPYEVPRDVPPDLSMQHPEPLLQVNEGRIRISMTRVGAMVTLGAVLVLLVAAFAFGLAVGRPGSPVSQDQDAKLPPKGLHVAGTRVGGQQAVPTDNDQDRKSVV